MSGVINENAASPPATTRVRSICSVAYADDDMTSDDSTARAVGLPRRWPPSSLAHQGRAQQDPLHPVAGGLGKGGREGGVGPGGGPRGRCLRGLCLCTGAGVGHD